MARKYLDEHEKPLIWIGSSKKDLLTFPDEVRDAIGLALSVAQFGSKVAAAKPWKGDGAGILEVVEDHRGDTFRAVYTVRYENAIYVLHTFQKKSKSGIATPRTDKALITSRLKLAEQHYKERHG